MGTIDEGPKPAAIADIKWEVELKQYKVPKELERVLKMDNRQAKMRSIRDYMPREFTCETYTRQFHTLLHIEEHKAAYVIHAEDLYVPHDFLGWISNGTTKKQLRWNQLHGRTSTSPSH